ncbi:MAG TPA: TerC family protein, partial [Phycisphaerales bacterium]|nr:TerC family protein [Phycisphaerales bacterium]
MFTLYIGFVGFVLVMLALDLFVVNRKPHAISTKAALFWTGVCVVLALGFSGVVYYLYDQNHYGLGDAVRARHAAMMHSTSTPTPASEMDPISQQISPGKHAMLEFLSGWLIEYSLSLDNIFVIALIFAHFRIPREYQHRVLFWGILGALIMRGLMIGVGAVLIKEFQWILYFFGAVLIYTAFKMLRGGEDHIEPEEGFVYRAARKLFPLHPKIEGQKFFIKLDGKLFMTPMFLVLLIVESTDVIFAIDSIPAIFAITQDPFLVFTSNVFAILGLRSMYFALAAMMDKFRLLKYSLAFVLAFIGVKMILTYWHIHFGTGVSLGVIAAALAAGVVASLVIPVKKT